MIYLNRTLVNNVKCYLQNADDKSNRNSCAIIVMIFVNAQYFVFVAI